MGSEVQKGTGGRVPLAPGGHHVLDAYGEALGLGRPLPDQVGPTGVGFEQVVCLLPLHVACKPRDREEVRVVTLTA